MKTVYIIPLVLPTTGIIPRKLNDSLKLLNLHSTVYFLTQKSVYCIRAAYLESFLAKH